MLASGQWSEKRGDNVLDSGAPWYDTYETQRRQVRRDRRDRAEVLRRAAGAARAGGYRLCPRSTTAPAGRRCASCFAARFASRTRDEWCAAFDGSDACFAPVLTFAESRETLTGMARRWHASSSAASRSPRPAPRFSRTPGAARRPPPERGAGATVGTAAIGASIRAEDRSARGARRRLRLGPQRPLHSARASPAATPSSRSFSRCAVSERIAIGCRRAGTSA